MGLLSPKKFENEKQISDVVFPPKSQKVWEGGCTVVLDGWRWVELAGDTFERPKVIAYSKGAMIEKLLAHNVIINLLEY